MRKVMICLLVLPLLFSCSRNDLKVDNENLKQEMHSVESPVLKELVLDRRGKNVVWADAGGALFGVLKGGWWGALLFGAMASLAQAVIDQPLVIQDTSMDDFILNERNPYEFIGVSHYASINSELISSLSKYVSLDNSIKEEHYIALENFLSVNNKEFSEIDQSLYLKNDYKSDFPDFKSFFNLNEVDKQQFLANSISKEALDIYKDYQIEFANSNNVLNFIETSLLYEDMVLDNQSMTSIDRKTLLGMMSTARIGAQYWGAIFYNN